MHADGPTNHRKLLMLTRRYQIHAPLYHYDVSTTAKTRLMSSSLTLSLVLLLSMGLLNQRRLTQFLTSPNIVGSIWDYAIKEQCQ